MMNIEALKAKIASKQKEFVKTEKPFTAKSGDTSIVLLQGWNPENREVFWHEFGGHYIRGNDGKVAAFYPCDNAIFNKPCPICAMLRKASSMTTDQATLDQIKQMNANTVYLVNAIVLGENNNQPVVFQLSKSAFEQLLNTIGSWMSAVFDEKNPQVLCIKRTGTGFDTKYMVTVTPEKFTLPADTYNNVKNLDEYVNQRTDALMQKTANAISATLGVSMALPAPTATPMVTAAPTAQARPAQTIAAEDIPSSGAYVAPEPVRVAEPQVAPASAPKAQQVAIDDPDLASMLEGIE